MTAATGMATRKALWHRHSIRIILILAVGCGIYLNSFTVPFQFDDVNCLTKNPAIMDFSCFTDRDRLQQLPIALDFKNNFILRPLAYFTFAVNFRLHGLEVWGYHAVNLALHLANGLLVYALLFLILRTPFFSRRGDLDEGFVPLMPLFAGLLFVAHPLQTQAVTYIIQRFCPLATMFCLGAAVLYAIARLSPSPLRMRLAYGGALLAAVAAMESKEIAFTLPLNIALMEAMFFTGSRTRRALLVAPFLLTMLIIPWKAVMLAQPEAAGFGAALTSGADLINYQKVSRADYLMTQFGVIVKYLQLLLLPAGQNLDYDWPLRTSLFHPAVILPLGILLALAAAAASLLVRSGREGADPLGRVVSFGIFWFFITLSVESSFIPIDDYIFEHRAYLPSVGFFIALLGGIALLHRRSREAPRSLWAPAIPLGIAVAVLSVLTVVRNGVWQTERTLWQDAAAKSPGKARPHSNLGRALLREAQLADAARELELSLQLDQKDASARNNLGLTLIALQRTEEATEQLRKALSLKPDDPEYLVNLAGTLIDTGRLDEARGYLRRALQIDPWLASAYVVTGMVLEAEGRLAEAVQLLEAAERMPLRDPMIWQVSADLRRLRGMLAEARTN